MDANEPHRHSAPEQDNQQEGTTGMAVISKALNALTPSAAVLVPSWPDPSVSDGVWATAASAAWVFFVFPTLRSLSAAWDRRLRKMLHLTEADLRRYGPGRAP